MIKLSHGDLLEATENIIIHQVNCQGKMNSGIAKQIRDKWPQAYIDYMRWYSLSTNGGDSLLGKAQFVQVSEDKFVANLFGQEYYGYDGKRYTSYDALYDGLTYIKKYAQMYNKSVALPYNIGCDRGGADWFIVDAMVQRIFADYEVHIYKLEGK